MTEFFIKLQDGQVIKSKIKRGCVFEGKKFGILDDDSVYKKAGLLPLIEAEDPIFDNVFFNLVVTYEIYDDRVEEIKTIEPRPIEEIKKYLLSKSKKIRKKKVVAGIPIGESSLATDNNTRDILIGLKLLSTENPDKTWNWKNDDGWIILDKDMIVYFSGLIADHTQICFDREKELVDMIEASVTISELQNIDIYDGWPDVIQTESNNF